MNVSKLADVMTLQPFRSMTKVKINSDGDCVLANRCFVKVSQVRAISRNAVTTDETVRFRNHEFTLSELLFSLFHFQRPQFQYLLPGFVLSCIDEAARNNKTCHYCIVHRDNSDRHDLNLNVFVPTATNQLYVVIGLRIRSFWSATFEID
uniref:Putative F15L protein n=1 Tax=Squirrelpox virus TaxID=240426 RepID=Q6VFS2_9POXV|nr:putative F15L protein [Squirrelpox virus]